HDPGTPRRSAARGAALQPSPAARLREPEVRAGGGARGARGHGPGRGPGIRGERRGPDPRRPGPRSRAASRGDPPAARLPRAVPPPAHTRYGGGNADPAREPVAAVPRGIRDRPRGVVVAGRPAP